METPYELLIRYYQKKTTFEENLQVEQWLSQGNNSLLFVNLKQEWRYIDDHTIVRPDKQNIWRKIQGKTTKPQNTTINRQFSFLKTLVAASVIIALITTTVYFLNLSKQQEYPMQYTSVTTQSNEKSKVDLPDGTEVWLNSNSIITFNDSYNNDNREITVNGELFLDVKPSGQKFIINAGKIKIEVLGTSFNLKTFDTEHIDISLIRGKIAVFNSENNKQLFQMDASQNAVINKTDLTHTLQIENTSLSSIWTEESLLMDNEPLEEIITKLENWYGIKISCSGLDVTKHYTFQLQNESLYEFLDLFSEITPIDYNITGKNLHIEAQQIN